MSTDPACNFHFTAAMTISRLFDAIGLFADEELVGTSENKLIAVDFDFAPILSSPCWN